MGMPQPVNAPSSSQESLSNVLVDLTNHVDGIEKSVIGLCSRLLERKNEPMREIAQVNPPPGVVGHAMSIRNTVIRLQAHVEDLERLI